jgi:hypothetical protein
LEHFYGAEHGFAHRLAQGVDDLLPGVPNINRSGKAAGVDILSGAEAE